jgi:hypothetical protein
MTTKTTELWPARLRREFKKVSSEGRLGGSSVLSDLADLAFECCFSTDNNKAAVAVALMALFKHYSDLRTEAVVVGDDFTQNHSQLISDAIDFINKGGSEKTEIEIAAHLARSLSRSDS